MVQAVKNLPANAGEPGSIPGSGRPPREGNGNPLQYSYIENPMDFFPGLSLVGYSPWGYKSQMQLSNWHFFIMFTSFFLQLIMNPFQGRKSTFFFFPFWYHHMPEVQEIFIKWMIILEDKAE